MNGDDQEWDPTGVRTAFRIWNKAFALARGERRWLQPVVLRIFVATLLLTTFWVYQVSPVANFDAIRPFYEIGDNSTTSAHRDQQSKEELEGLQIIGELCWDVTTVEAIFIFSEAYRLQGAMRPRRSWRECKISLFFAIIVWEIVYFFALSTLHANGFEDLSRKFDAIFGSWCLLTAVVVSQENVHGFRAMERAWELVCQKLKEVSVIGAMFLLMQAALFHVYQLVTEVFCQHDVKKEGQEAPPAVGEHTAAQILMFSLLLALLNVVMQSFTCSVILVLYKESNRQIQDVRPNAVAIQVREIENEVREIFQNLMREICQNQVREIFENKVREVKNGITKDIKTIKRLTSMLAKHSARDNTVQLFAGEVLKHCDRTLEHVQG